MNTIIKLHSFIKKKTSKLFLYSDDKLFILHVNIEKHQVLLE